MRRRRVLVFAAGAAALLGTGPPAVPGAAGAPIVAAGAVRAAGLWGRAIEPGAAGRPAAAVRAAGSWGRAIEVPGLGALNKGRNAGVLSVSCPSPGNCAAGGYYTDGGGHQQGFVVSERNGRWGQAVEVPGLGALNKGRWAEVSSVSCASPGNCAAGGYYGNHGSNPHVVTSGRGFVVSERNGRWGRAVEVPGLGALNKGGNAGVSSVSCASPGNCAAVGDYRDGGRHQQGFVVSEKNGSWGTAQEVAGSLNDGGGATVTSVSCASAGNCSAGGQYDDGSGSQQAFVISEVNGTWASAQEVAGSMNDVGGDASVTSVSCAPAGNCSAGGQLETGGAAAAFVVSEKNGAWGQAIYVPGLNAVARFAYLNSVSCSSAGNCAAGGDYEGFGSGVFVVREKNGVWGHETTVPGLGALNKGSSLGVSSVSCAPAGNCVAGGYYQETGRYALQGFVT